MTTKKTFTTKNIINAFIGLVVLPFMFVGCLMAVDNATGGLPSKMMGPDREPMVHN